MVLRARADFEFAGERKRGGAKIVIRKGTYINRYTVIDAFEKVDIGELEAALTPKPA